MTVNVPTIEKGSARLGMIVAETFRRNRKITSTTSTAVSSSVNLTSSHRLADRHRPIAPDLQLHRRRQLLLAAAAAAP